MRNVMLALLLITAGLTGCETTSGATADAPWDPAATAKAVDAARQAREKGDLQTAEMLCYRGFQRVDAATLASYDAYADLAQADGRPDARAVREQAVKLRATKASQGQGKEPGSSYLGFAPADGLDAYADLLQSHARVDDARRAHALAIAYRQVQQAHFDRTMLYRQGRDPRGVC